MVEIRYGEHYEQADLAGKSVAEVREQYKEEFGIPDKAQASLDGKGLRKKHEPETHLSDDDELSFAEKSRKGLFFIGTVLLAFVTTSGIFAYGALTAGPITATVTSASADFAAVAAGTPPTPSWTYWGGFKGAIAAHAGVFTVTPEPTQSFSGDMVIQVYITNPDALIKAYRVLFLTIQVTDDAATIFGPQVLTLENPVAEIEVSSYDVSGATGYLSVDLVSGFYVSHFWKAAISGNEAPNLFCKVIQAGP